MRSIGDSISFVRLYQVCDIIGRIGFRGYTRNDIVDPMLGAISLSPSNIKGNTLSLENNTYISWSKYNESPEIMIKDNDIVFCKTGSVGKTAIVKRVDWKMTINPQLTIFRAKEVNPSYLSHVVASFFFQNEVNHLKGTGSVSTISQKDLGNIVIPIPSQTIQEEIVKILDSFTNLIDALNEELSLRQKQFEYYREKLLTFDKSVKSVELEDVGFFYGGLSGKSKKDFLEGNKKFVTYMNVFTNSTISLDIEDKVKIYDGEKQNKIAYGDILFTGSSETPDECGMSSVVVSEVNEDIYLNSFCFGYRFFNLKGLCPKFVSYLMRSHSVRNEISKTANGVTRFNVSKKLLGKVKVVIPSLSIQQSIVEKLDAFESLISSLKEEIELRQKQYEYYREKLLTFE